MAFPCNSRATKRPFDAVDQTERAIYHGRDSRFARIQQWLEEVENARTSDADDEEIIDEEITDEEARRPSKRRCMEETQYSRSFGCYLETLRCPDAIAFGTEQAYSQGMANIKTEPEDDFLEHVPLFAPEMDLPEGQDNIQAEPESPQPRTMPELHLTREDLIDRELYLDGITLCDYFEQPSEVGYYNRPVDDDYQPSLDGMTLYSQGSANDQAMEAQSQIDGDGLNTHSADGLEQSGTSKERDNEASEEFRTQGGTVPLANHNDATPLDTQAHATLAYEIMYTSANDHLYGASNSQEMEPGTPWYFYTTKNPFVTHGLPAAIDGFFSDPQRDTDE